jgi:hypothetical protein
VEQQGTARRYRIVVRGRLSDRFAAGFGRFEVEAASGGSALTGTFADQTQLFGLLDQLRDFGIELVSVDVVD